MPVPDVRVVVPRSATRGSALQKRLRDREKETERDERDRKREREEMEEIRQRLLAEGHPDPDAELQRVRPPGAPSAGGLHLLIQLA